MKDIVCGMTVHPDAALTSQYRGVTYYLCSSTCKRQFDRNPAQYVDAH
jgi:Cu+-exporting ATPase